MTFENLNLIPEILDALRKEGYVSPTPIQEQAIPVLMQGKDLLGCAQTGTGKTAAFAIPILQALFKEKANAQGRKPIRALVLTPTRELAIQINESFEAYGCNTGLRHTVIFGGVSQFGQTTALKKGIDILIATPGRLLDLMQQGFVKLDQVSHFVLDEADRMLDMGFIHDVKKVLAKLPARKQNLLFSATMPHEIVKLASSFLHNPVKVEVTPVSSTAEKVEQFVYFVEQKEKKSLLIQLLKGNEIGNALVFTRTKHGANKLSKDLSRAGILTEAIHGNKSQNARQAALSGFKEGKVRVLVATDIAARGIDINELSHVVNFELPNIPESYVHRIGRTGRAGASGIAISFCGTDERAYLRDIEKLIGMKVTVARHEFDLSKGEPEQPRTEVRKSESRSHHTRTQTQPRRQGSNQSQPRKKLHTNGSSVNRLDKNNYKGPVEGEPMKLEARETENGGHENNSGQQKTGRKPWWKRKAR